ncbi:MAG TPA: S-layer homology domain-containing protein [Candidatus Avoscillospira avistercoris]|uniref:S-layer homology domain-containing protein n=1 Tax=Candidatus Avoscillospira avistercoris TaxID=2840707 RepID=A0A9D1F9G5_9FIRM|nr:S-layer homology domain-containing protein [Candidatus Avoscillospira avistercoris]
MKKKFLSLLLSAALVLAMVLPASAAFTDITDSQLQKQVSVLQMLGVIGGTSASTFSPNGTLSRAQFCKMAVVLLGRENEEPLYRNRTIFPDVKSSHWARGYINLAVSVDVGGSTGENGQTTGGVKLIRGMADGTFQPDRAITYAEAVTILMRVLGYSDTDAGMNWPTGYLQLAAKLGVTDGLSGLNANSSLTRAQAATMFYQALFAKTKDGSPYYQKLGTAKTGVILTGNNGKLEDGSTGGLVTSDGNVYKLANGASAPAELVGQRGMLLLRSQDNAVLTFLPQGTQKTVSVDKAEAAWFTDDTGHRYTIGPTTPVYTPNESTTYEKLWMDLRGGSVLTVYYNDTGKIESAYYSMGASSDTVMIAKSLSNGGNPFGALLNGAVNYKIYRDGNPATVADIQEFDVGIYDATARVLQVSSAKLTGTYDNVEPNEKSPVKVTMLGMTFELMTQAQRDMAKFKLGDRVTLLLTADGRVAGVRSASEVESSNVGILEKADGGDVEVKLLSGLTIKSKASNTAAQQGQLVTVSSKDLFSVYVSPVTSSNVSGSLDVASGKVGNLSLSTSCRIYDQAGGGQLVEVSLDDLALPTVPNNKITYAYRNASGRIDVLVLNDVTGDGYTYGKVSYGDQDDVTVGVKVVLTNGEGTKTAAGAVNVPGTGWGGIAFSGDGTKAMATVPLKTKANVHRSAFTERDGKTYVTLGDQELRVSDKVQCYNSTTGQWLEDLETARAFAERLTVYYDRNANEGGKVRVVVVE